MSRLTRDELTPVLIYKGPATGYKEDVVEVSMKNNYRLIDSRFLKKDFVSKMQKLEAIAKKEGKDVKLMLIEGKDVKLFTPKPKETKLIQRTREQRAIEATEASAKAMELMAMVSEGSLVKSSDVDALKAGKDEAELKAMEAKEISDSKVKEAEESKKSEDEAKAKLKDSESKAKALQVELDELKKKK